MNHNYLMEISYVTTELIW